MWGVFIINPNLGSDMRTHIGAKIYLCHTCIVHFTQKGPQLTIIEYMPMIIPTWVQCVTKVLSLKVQLNLILWYTLVTKYKHVQYVRIFQCQGVLYVTPYGTVWWKGLCVFGTWECINWADQFEETCETAQWWETFPLSLWWEFHSEMCSKEIYCKTALSKVVICNIQDFWDVTTYSITSRGVNCQLSKTVCSTHAKSLKLFIFCM